MIQIKTPAASLTFNQSGGWYKGEDGKDGQDGYTPIKGVDYWTEEDKLEIINELEDMEEVHVGDEPDADSDALLWMYPDDGETFDVDDYYTKNEVDDKIAQAALDGTVDLSSYVKKTDIGSNTNLGLVKTLSNGTAYGVNINSAGNLSIVGANATDIAGKNHAYKPLTPNNLDYAIEVGLTTNTRTLSAEKQAAAKAWLGIVDGDGSGNVDLTNYYTKSEVDAAIENIELTPGPAGKDGYTPVKGVDYFDGEDGKDGSDYVLTDADKQEIASMVEVTGGGSADMSNYYNKDEVDDKIADFPVKQGAGANSLMHINSTAAGGSSSVALGIGSNASGMFSVAIGDTAAATFSDSFAFGRGVTANKYGQVVIGNHNASDDNAKFIIGNGTSASAKLNAMTVGADNVAHFPGNVKVGADDAEVATKTYVDEAVNAALGVIENGLY